MKIIFSFFFILILSEAKSQNNSGNKFDIRLKYGENIVPSNLKKHLYSLAGKEMEGRAVGTLGERKAAYYIINYFKINNLQPGAKGEWQQLFRICYDTILHASIMIGNKMFEYGIHYKSLRTGNKNEDIQANECVFAGYGISTTKYDDYDGVDVSGKIVLILDGQPKLNDSIYLITGTEQRDLSFNSYNTKLKTAFDKGAIAVLLLNDIDVSEQYYQSTRRSGSYVMDGHSKKNSPPINMYTINADMAATLFGMPLSEMRKAIRERTIKSKYVKKKIKLKLTANNIWTGVSSNVLGYIEGTDKKDEVIFITAHYDHLGRKYHDHQIFYGADDNASGVSALLEIAAAFSCAKKDGNGPRRSIVFMTVSGEEMSMWGSGYYTIHPLYSLKKTIVNLNMDMIGRVGYDYQKDKDSINYVYTIGDDSISSELKRINDSINKVYTNLKLDNSDKENAYTRSDHYMFAKNNIPIIFYYNGPHKEYHSPGDTPDKINYELLTKRAKLVFYTAWEIANREKRLQLGKERQ